MTAIIQTVDAPWLVDATMTFRHCDEPEEEDNPLQVSCVSLASLWQGMDCFALVGSGCFSLKPLTNHSRRQTRLVCPVDPKWSCLSVHGLDRFVLHCAVRLCQLATHFWWLLVPHFQRVPPFRRLVLTVRISMCPAIRAKASTKCPK